jgi:hypothetical protein
VGRVAILALTAASCSLGDTPLVGIVPSDSAPSDAGPDGRPPVLDAGADASSCAVDVDDDGSCADVDCDDRNSRRSPASPEYCPDRIDNDCDDLVDFADECGALNDACGGPLAVLRQEEDRNETFWQFDLPLDRYQDDVVAGLSAGEGDCVATSGQNGRDAIFQLVATADSAVEATATGSMGAVPVLILQLSACGQGAESDDCDTADADASPASVVAALDSGAFAWLVVDDAAATLAGVVQLEVRITRRVPH